MSKEILVNITPQETRVAVIEQGVVQELHIERASSLGKVGNIYNGRVRRVLPGMQSAFIDIGLDRAAFLHIADIWGARQDGEAIDKPIEKLLHEGEDILVQVIKDPISSKGARLSTQISIAGRMLVYLPQESNIGISQRIEDETERELLREKMQILTTDEKGGYIVRTMAENADEHDLQTDIKYLGRQWLNIQDQSIKEVGFNFGFGIPFQGFSNLNIGFELGKRGTTNSGLIQENFFSIRLGMSLSDLWFVKNKYN